MTVPTPSAIGILGTGSYLPERVVDNVEVGRAAGVGAAWIEDKTGIRFRRRAAPDEATSDLAARAAAAALDAAGITAAELSYLVVATSTPDQPQPATACFVQHRIGARAAAAFDLNAVCSGFVFGLAATAGLLGGAGYGLVIGADLYSRILNPADRRTAVLFGDGAGAVVLGPVPLGQGVLDVRLASDGARRELIGVPAGGSKVPASPATLASGAHYFQMTGREVRDYVAEHVPPMLTELVTSCGLSSAEVDHFVPHQANGLMLADLARRVGLAEQTRLTVRDYANTGAAAVPITLDRRAPGPVGVARRVRRRHVDGRRDAALGHPRASPPGRLVYRARLRKFGPSAERARLWSPWVPPPGFGALVADSHRAGLRRHSSGASQGRLALPFLQYRPPGS